MIRGTAIVAGLLLVPETLLRVPNTWLAIALTVAMLIEMFARWRAAPAVYDPISEAWKKLLMLAMVVLAAAGDRVLQEMWPGGFRDPTLVFNNYLTKTMLTVLFTVQFITGYRLAKDVTQVQVTALLPAFLRALARMDEEHASVTPTPRRRAYDHPDKIQVDHLTELVREEANK